MLIGLFSELKKDPGIPRLPNLKQRNAEKQKLHAVRRPSSPHV